MTFIKNFFKRDLLMILMVGLFSCSDENVLVSPDDPTENAEEELNENIYINNWIYENMEAYYFWTTEISDDPDFYLDPESFFESLLYTYDETFNPEGDRFSFISNDADALLAEFSGETLSTGMQFRLFYKASTGSEIIAQVIYTLPDSPADEAGLSRGDIITRVNGEILDEDNYATLLFGNDNMTITLAEVVNNAFVEQSTVLSITATTVQENPIYLDSIYNFNGINVGYLVYNQFIPGPNNSIYDDYDDELKDIFSGFKAMGVQELVVDLRYNPGGYVSSSIILASLIGSGINSSDIFYQEEYNEDFQAYLRQYYGSDYFYINFEDLPENLGNQIDRVYFLVSNYTASSSELLINGLKPYMDVVLIGEKTYGKNVGSFTLTDENSSENNWALQPIVVKSYNSLGQSDYTAGFTPDVEAYESLELVPFGNIEDPLLAQALNMIGGFARIAHSDESNIPVTIDMSIQQKKLTMRKFVVNPY